MKEEEEDKELLKIRIETLKTMIGKLKHKKLPTQVELNDKATTPQTSYKRQQSKPSNLQQSSKLPLLWSRKKSMQNCYKYKYQKPVEKSVDQELLANDKIPSSVNLRVSSDPFKWTNTSCSRKKSVPNTPVTKRFIAKRRKSAELIVSKYKVVKKRLSDSQKTISHRKVQSRTKWAEKRPILASPSNTSTPLVLCLYGHTKERPRNQASNILSKYKFVRKSENKEQKETYAFSSNAYVWRVGDKKPKDIFSSAKTSIDHPFIRRRYKVRRKSDAQKFRYKTAPILPHSARWSRYTTGSSANKSFISRRVQYITRSSPVSVKSHASYQQAHPMNSTKATVQSPLQSPSKNIILTRHGSNYQLAGNLKSLRRLPGSSQSGIKKKCTNVKPLIRQTKYKLQRQISDTKTVSVRRLVASQVLKKTILQVQRKKVNKTKFCLFYNRFGKCKRDEKCNYIHDPDKVAVCTRFLRGTCKDEKCLFSHKVDPNKMPVCSYFMLGKCSRDNCPYRHVNVGKAASVCEDFLTGYCPAGEKCTKKHILECEEYVKDGCCSKGKSCKLIHRVRARKNKRHCSASTSGARKPRAFAEKRRKLQESTTAVTNGGPSVQRLLSPLKNKEKSHLLPKFISDKMNQLSAEPAAKLNSFSAMRNLFTAVDETPTFHELTTQPTDQVPGPSSKGNNNLEEFIPLTCSSESESDSEIGHISRRFSFKEQDFISLN